MKIVIQINEKREGNYSRGGSTARITTLRGAARAAIKYATTGYPEIIIKTKDFKKLGGNFHGLRCGEIFGVSTWLV